MHRLLLVSIVWNCDYGLINENLSAKDLQSMAEQDLKSEPKQNTVKRCKWGIGIEQTMGCCYNMQSMFILMCCMCMCIYV